MNFVRPTFRFLDLAPDQLVLVGLRGGFDLSFHFGTMSWPGTWLDKEIRQSALGALRPKNHPLAQRPTLSQVIEHPRSSPPIGPRKLADSRQRINFPPVFPREKPVFL